MPPSLPNYPKGCRPLDEGGSGIDGSPGDAFVRGSSKGATRPAAQAEIEQWVANAAAFSAML
jgi:hypothetical protein